MENITSRNNDKIKYAVSLKNSASARRKSGCFFLEGARLCADAAKSGADILQFFFTKKAAEKFPDYYGEIIKKSGEAYIISNEISSRLSDTESPQGLFCVCRAVDKIAKADKINSKGKYILLENVQDPSNLGAAARTAEALGINGLIVSGGCDIYNPKALRASMGAFFRLNVFECGEVCGFIGEIQKSGMRAVSSTPSAKAQDVTKADLSGGIVCIVGNEGAGVTPEVRAASDFEVTIPMKGSAESLNASTAAAILMWEMMRRGD